MAGMTNRPTITPEMVEKFARYYQQNPTWGSLHIVMDVGRDAEVEGDVRHLVTVSLHLHLLIFLPGLVRAPAPSS